ncbi:MAG TPA: hypothetical protein PLE30_04470 [Candidatus Kapabacteria bacterium]|nr:hypothetical protein [Candidatus Kapabacteria bacterium]
MLKKILLLLCVAIILPNIAHSEDPYQILDKYLEVTKASIRKDSIQSLKFTVVENASNPQTGQTASATVKYWYKKDSLYRVEQEAQGQKLKVGYDGKMLWWASPIANGKLEEVPSSYADQVKAQIVGENIVGGSYANYNKDSLKLEFVEKVTADEKELFKIKLIGDKADQTMFLFFDAISGLLYKIEIETPQGIYARKTKNVTKSAGFFFPLKVEEWLGDKKVSEKTYQTITVNPKIDERFFAMPEK